MSAEIIEFIEARARRAERARANVSQQSSAPEFVFWEGGSGARYVHTVHSLIACPELPPCTYVLAYRASSGERDVLAIGQLTGAVASLNLAELRHRGARLGANEIHVHLIASSPVERHRVVLDLKSVNAPCGQTSKVASAI